MRSVKLLAPNCPMPVSCTCSGNVGMCVQDIQFMVGMGFGLIGVGWVVLVCVGC